MGFFDLTSDHPTACWNWTEIANTKGQHDLLGSGKLLNLQDTASATQKK